MLLYTVINHRTSTIFLNLIITERWLKDDSSPNPGQPEPCLVRWRKRCRGLLVSLPSIYCFHCFFPWLLDFLTARNDAMDSWFVVNHCFHSFNDWLLHFLMTQNRSVYHYLIALLLNIIDFLIVCWMDFLIVSIIAFFYPWFVCLIA